MSNICNLNNNMCYINGLSKIVQLKLQTQGR